MPVDALGLGYTAVATIDPTTGLPVGAQKLENYVLLRAATANTGATSTAANPFVSGIRGGDYIWQVEGVFGGATATLQRRSLDGVNWKTVRNAANTADVTATVDASIGVGVGQGAEVRVLLTGATGTTLLNSSLAGLS